MKWRRFDKRTWHNHTLPYHKYQLSSRSYTVYVDDVMCGTVLLHCAWRCPRGIAAWEDMGSIGIAGVANVLVQY